MRTFLRHLKTLDPISMQANTSGAVRGTADDDQRWVYPLACHVACNWLNISVLGDQEVSVTDGQGTVRASACSHLGTHGL